MVAQGAARRAVCVVQPRRFRHRPDPASSAAITDPDDREVVGILRRGARVRTRGERAAIDRAAVRGDGAVAGGVRARFRSGAAGAAASTPIVHRWTRGEDLAALVLILQRMLRAAGRSRSSFVEGYDPARRTLSGARIVLHARARRPICGRRMATASRARRRLLLLAPVVRRRVQAAEPVPALDGQARCRGFRHLEERSAVQADRSARHPRDPRRQVSAADALHEPGMEDGGRHHRVAARAGSRRSSEVRLLAVSSGNGGWCGFNRAQGDAQCPLRGLCHPRQSWCTPA